MAKASSTQLDELAETHGRLASVVVAGTLHAFRAATAEEMDRYQDSLSKRRIGASHRELAQVTCVTDLNALKAAFEKRAALATGIANAICDLAGSEYEVPITDDTASVVVDGVTLSFRAPSLEEWEDHQERLRTVAQVASARQLAQACHLGDAETLKKTFARYPLLVTRVAESLRELAGLDIEVTVKKG